MSRFKFALKASAAICVAFMWQHSLCQAQIIYSLGTQEVYDSNIFLESGKASTTLPPTVNGKQSEETDGKVNSDFISNPYVSMAGRIPTGSKLVTNFTTRLGAVLYDNDNQENRFTVDGLLNFTPEEGVLPEHWTLNLSEGMTSQAGAVGVAQGSAAQQGQINTVTLGGGLTELPLSSQDSLSVPAGISRQDFLGQFLFNSQSGSQHEDIQGADSITYSLTPDIKHHFSDRFSVDVSNLFQYYVVTGGDTNNNQDNLGSKQNRFNDTPAVGGSYDVSERLKLGARIGEDFSEFTEDQDTDRSKSQSSLFYSGNASYAASTRTMLGANVLQTGGTDIDGNRLLVRTAGANASQVFADTLSGNAGFVFTQFNQGDTLDKPSDRYEVIVNFRYSLTDAIAISFGYSYANQHRPDDGNAVLFNNGDYTGNRAFVSLDTGFVAFAK